MGIIKNSDFDGFFIYLQFMKNYIYIILFLTTLGFAQNKINAQSQQVWIDSTYNSLSFEEKVGQLFMIAAYSNKNETHAQDLDKLITKYKVGGLIFFQGGPVRQALQTNAYQSIAKTPLFIAIDAEWGLGMRLDSTISFPRAMTLGASMDEKLIYELDKRFGIENERTERFLRGNLGEEFLLKNQGNKSEKNSN